MSGMRTVEEHRDRVIAAVPLLPHERVPLADAAGRTLTAPIVARTAVPRFDNSSMDGFAVRFADVSSATPDRPVRLEVVADLAAGTTDSPAIGPGQAARIMTGAPVPPDADAIVPFEDTSGGLADSLTTAVVQRAPAASGVFIRRRGEDMHPGDLVVAPGVEVGARVIAAAIATGAVSDVAVARRPRVAIISTGAELAGEDDGPGRIPDSNGPLLAALTTEAAGEVVRMGRVSDDPQAFAAELEQAADADVVITTGGVSAGAYEVVRIVLGDRIDFARVAMQPGKPQAFGRLGDGPVVFGLPGNPVSVAVSFETFVRPALLTMQHRAVVHRPVIRLRAGAGWRTPPGRRQYLPVTIDRTDPAAWTVFPASSGGSHLAGHLARAEAYAVVPAEAERVAAGDAVDVMLV